VKNFSVQDDKRIRISILGKKRNFYLVFINEFWRFVFYFNDLFYYYEDV